MAEVKNYWGVRADSEIRQAKQQKQELWDGMHRFDAAMKYIAEGMSDEELIKKNRHLQKGADGQGKAGLRNA